MVTAILRNVAPTISRLPLVHASIQYGPYCHAVMGCSVALASIEQLCFPKLEHQASAIQIMNQAWDVALS
jgi:hypothetical protein